MRTKITLLLTVFTLLLGGMLAVANPAAAGPPTREDFSGSFLLNPCAPDDGYITFSGFIQITPNKDGSLNAIIKVSGVSDTGVKYQISETVKVKSSADGSFSQVVRLHLVSQGSGDNYFLDATFSYDPVNGYQSTFNETCRG